LLYATKGAQVIYSESSGTCAEASIGSMAECFNFWFRMYGKTYYGNDLPDILDLFMLRTCDMQGLISGSGETHRLATCIM